MTYWILSQVPAGGCSGKRLKELIDLSQIRLLEVRKERWRLRMEERLDRKAEAVLAELDGEKTYLSEVLAVLLASSWRARKRVMQVMDLF